MNVAFDKWIPVVTSDGKPVLASLLEVMTEGHRFADFSVRPHERVSLMRLFLCVAHAALDGPQDYDAWCAVPKRLPTAALAYLKKWKESFDLFHPNKPWLQVAEISRGPERKADEEEDWSPVSKLGFFLATGANTTLFDHEGSNNDGRVIPLHDTVLSLLSFQCFSVGGLISQVVWDGVKTSKSSKDAPCVPASMAHGLLRGEHLFASIHLNMPTYDDVHRSYGVGDVGRPVWEQPPRSFKDQEAVANATTTYVGRLVPLTRIIRLRTDGQRMLLGDGLVYPSFADGFAPEPTATVVIRTKDKKQERALLSYRPSRALWRELGAIVVRRSGDGMGGPLSLKALQEGQACDLVVVALARDQATIVDTTESVFHIPPRLRSEEGVGTYTREIQVAEDRARLLGWAVETYREEIDGGWEGRLKGAGASKGELRSRLHARALTHFWTAVEKNLGLLMTHVESIGSDRAPPTLEAWRKMLFTSACEAFQTICGQDTPREMKAFALGWRRLFSKVKGKETAPQGEEAVE